MSAVELDLCTDEPLPEDTVEEWLAKQPAPPFVPLALKHFVVPSHPWVIEVDGFPFPSLATAEFYAQHAIARGEHPVIYCRLDRKKDPS